MYTDFSMYQNLINQTTLEHHIHTYMTVYPITDPVRAALASTSLGSYNVHAW